MTSDTDWTAYLRTYHAANPSITEQVLQRSTHRTAGTPYEWLRSAVPAEPGVVLDVACGSAPLHDHFRTATTYLGIDVSSEELRAGKEHGRASLARADAFALPMAAASIDVVVCSMALMLMDPVAAALREVARVLRPGGVFAMIRPVGTPLLPRDLRLVLPVLRGLGTPPQMPQRFSARTLRGALESAGLDVESDAALRFSHPLTTTHDAQLAMRALYLPDVTDDRRSRAASLLHQHAGPGRDLPVSIRRTVARRSTLDVRGSR
jgi:SAM-dependent methyltransferase